LANKIAMVFFRFTWMPWANTGTRQATTIAKMGTHFPDLDGGAGAISMTKSFPPESIALVRILALPDRI
jgi:hypothetical protein